MALSGSLPQINLGVQVFKANSFTVLGGVVASLTPRISFKVPGSRVEWFFSHGHRLSEQYQMKRPRNI
ncbi:hypothetical protein TNCV_3788011 [Trichonephila clavipes]|nr:hypothetical protein TNCV_3788011 [Trichonephila clavipes]